MLGEEKAKSKTALSLSRAESGREWEVTIE
jgi:hypothetical protein